MSLRPGRLSSSGRGVAGGVVARAAGRYAGIAGPDLSSVFDIFAAEAGGVFHVAVGSGGPDGADFDAG